MTLLNVWAVHVQGTRKATFVLLSIDKPLAWQPSVSRYYGVHR